MGRDPTYLGTIQDVTGATASIELDTDTISGLVFVAGQPYRVGQVGSFVRIPIGLVDLFGVVSQVGAGAVPAALADANPFGHRWMTVQLVGEGQSERPFSRGLSHLPSIGDSAHLVIESDLVRIYGRADSARHVTIGRIAAAEAIPARLDINMMVTRHSAVVGSTGSGKSTTVAQILIALTDEHRYPSSRVVLFDVHGEYGAALGDRARIFRVSAGSSHQAMYVPYWALSFEELLPLTFGNLPDDSGRGAVRDEVIRLKRATLQLYPIADLDPADVTVDTPIPFSLHQLWFDLHRLLNATHTALATAQTRDTEAMEHGPDGEPLQPGDPLAVVAPRYREQSLAQGQERVYLSGSTLNIRRQVDALASRLRDKRFDFLLRPGPWLPALDGQVAEDLDSFLEQWVGGPRSVCILDLSGAPSEILAELVGALSRVLYDALFWARHLSEGARERPLLFVFEEAHAYLSHARTASASLAVQRIVKEGRKYGIGAMIVSQRPAEIDPTILAQCGTLIAMRLANSTDRSHVLGVVTDSLAGLLGLLPILRTGEAIIVGEAVPLPMRALIDQPAHLPDSADARVVEDDLPGGWNRRREPSNYGDVVTAWRRQDPRSTRLIAEEAENPTVKDTT